MDKTRVLLSFTYLADICKQQMKLPGFPTIKPPGYKPPEMFDPDMDREGKGYRIGTVRTWSEGPHVKTREGWFPYNPKTREIRQDDGKWVPYNTVSANQYPPKYSEYPEPKSFSRAKALVDNYQTPFKNDEERDDAFKKMMKISHNLGNFLKRVKEDASVDEEVEELWDEVEFNAKKAYRIGEGERHGISDSAVLDMAKHLSASLEDASNLTNSLRVFESRKRQGNFHMEVAQDIGDNPLLKELAQDPKLMKPLAAQGYLNLTQVRTLQDGTKTIFKHDAFSLEPSARNEAASYPFMEKLLGSDAVPASLLVKETVWNDTVLEDAKYKYSDTDKRPEGLNELTLDDLSAGVVQENVEGETLARAGYDGLSHDVESFDRLMSIVAFDLISGNWDRHHNNIMFGEDGMPNAIDNGEAFRYKHMAPDQYYIHDDLAALLDHARYLDEDMLKEAAKNVKIRLQSIKRNDLDDVLGGFIEEDKIRTAARRIPKVINRLMSYVSSEE